MQLARIDRADFLDNYWDYNPGEHVTFIEPTQGGKTHFACQLFRRTRGLKTMLVMKPRDPTPSEWTRRLGFREVPHWPPPAKWPWQDDAPGFTLWPRHGMTDINADNLHIGTQFQRMLLSAYRKGDQVVFADEVYGLIAELTVMDGKAKRHLDPELIAMWTRGSGMGAGLWAATQKPSGTTGRPIPTFMYSASTHLFLGRDTDKRNTDRFGEIGGVDPAIVSDAVRNLPVNKIDTPRGPKYISDKLYIDKRGPYLATIGP